MRVGRLTGAFTVLVSLQLSCGGSVERGPEEHGGLVAPEGGSSTGQGAAPGNPPVAGGSENTSPGVGSGPAVGGASAQGGAVGEAGVAAGGAEAGAAGAAECVDETCAPPVHISPSWVTEMQGSGRGPAWLRFAEEGQTVRAGVGETGNHKITTLDRATGKIVGDIVVDRRLVASDVTGRRQVHREDTEAVITIDGVETARLSGVGNTLQFSLDGSALTAHTCTNIGDTPYQLSVYDTSDGGIISSVETDLSCVYSDMTLLVDAARRRTLFAHPTHSELYVFDWDDHAISTVQIHQEARLSKQEPVNHEGTILTLALSPDARTLASVGAADGLAWLDADTLEVKDRVPDVPFFNLYDLCYCDYLSESPVAWSPDGTTYVTAHASGGLALRDARTQRIVKVLDAPQVERHLSSTGFGPVLMEFSDDGRQLVALYPQLAVAYRLFDTLR